jgi:hypothetical protein
MLTTCSLHIRNRVVLFDCHTQVACNKYFGSNDTFQGATTYYLLNQKVLLDIFGKCEFSALWSNIYDWAEHHILLGHMDDFWVSTICEMLVISAFEWAIVQLQMRMYTLLDTVHLKSTIMRIFLGLYGMDLTATEAEKNKTWRSVKYEAP